jgi:hypothetical protein
VILSCGALTEPGAAHGVGSVDSRAMARPVAGMLPPASSSLAAASANSAAFATKARTCAADTGRERGALGTRGGPKLVERRAVHQAALAADVDPHWSAALEE